ncbi:hypothetical protein LR48_Vigan09g088800 [Vigna angularis]|uniref:Uncharacterized protein n=1 Tax=Phaseolus angularis TaxID=3914 RepID=A0A0L9VC40_PHAAN|nr:hypothetical protein LR48_Vigan09g088800 [Vigna angularis]
MKVDVGECEGDGVDVCSWSCSGEDGNVDGNVDVNDDCMEGLVDINVDYDIEEEVGDGVGDWFGNVKVDVQYDGPSWTQMSDSDLDDGINSDDDRCCPMMNENPKN